MQRAICHYSPSKWITDPCYKAYLNLARNGSRTDPETVTEIQFTAKK